MRNIAKKRIILMSLALTLCVQLIPVTQINAIERDITDVEVMTKPLLETKTEIIPDATEETIVEATPENDEESTETEEMFLNDESGLETYAEGNYRFDASSWETLDRLLTGYLPTNGTLEWSEDHTITNMTLETGEMLVLLSVTDPVVYQNTIFTAGQGTTGGALDLTKTLILNENDSITFQGLGSQDAPFCGNFQRIASFTTEHPVFNALDYATASFNNNSISVLKTSDSSEPIVATNISFDSTKQLTVSINPNSSSATYGSVFGTIQGQTDATLQLEAVFSNAPLNNKPSDHAGMIANTVEGGTLELTMSSFPQQSNQEGDAIQIGTEGTNRHAGLLVGNLKDSKLVLKQAFSFPKSSIQSLTGGAGGLVGNVENSSISLEGNVDLSNIMILGKYSGGIAGIATNVSFVFGNNTKFIYSSTDSAKQISIGGNGTGFLGQLTSSEYTGGIFGKYSISEDAFITYDGTGFSFGDNFVLTSAASDTGGAGLLFGELNLNDKNFTVSSLDDSPLDLKIDINVLANKSGSIGGLIGNLTGTTAADTLVVNNVNVTSNATTGNAKYQGGLAGKVTNGSVRTTDVTISATNPAVTTNSYYGFGGLVGLLEEKCILNTNGTTTVSTSSAIAAGGGLVGEMKSGSVLRLSGTTDLSSVSYQRQTATTAPTATTKHVGQLVGYQNGSLIFATGSGNDDNWKYDRYYTSYKNKSDDRLDDIGNYGQVIRLVGKLSSDLIKIDDNTNTVSFKEHGNYGTISSANDFALHAIAFTSNDAFNLYGGNAVNTNNVTLIADIDLTGTGIQGLTRDNGTDVFAGNTNSEKKIIFDGGKNTLTINTGDVYGMRNGVPVTEADTGSGQCYRHGYYGLLGKVNSATVQNLTIQTKMNFGADVPSYAGAIIGYVDGGNATSTTDNTITKVTVNTSSSIIYTGDAVSNVGGFIGGVFGTDTGVKVQDSSSEATLTYNSKSTSAVLGGAVGKDTYQNSIAMTFDSVNIGGSITSEVTSYAHVGGLVGDISASSATSRESGSASVSLTAVTITTQIETKAQKNSNGTKYSSGGFLGYYWDNVDVNFVGSESSYAVTVSSNASLTTAGSAVGGLCFAATGRWNMQKKAVSMDTVSISNNNGDLGLLVCHGERQDNAGIYSTSNNSKALYIVMDTNWSTGYTLESVTISGNPDVYDEIVAYTAANGDIMNNDAGIVSLRTTGNTVVMDEDGSRNTYENRIDKFKEKINSNSRYYYNLNTMEDNNNDVVDSSSELVLWSVRKYCASNIKTYLPTIDYITIRNPSVSSTLDMKGYSYYPVTVTNANINLDGATITFYNKEIEALEKKEPVNKSTRVTETAEQTQHFAMHSGLLFNFDTDENSTQIATLTVKNCALLGTVGMVGNGSGALISGTIQRQEKGNHPVKLAITNVALDDSTPLAVYNFSSDYAPLFINKIGSYATVELSGVTASTTGIGSASATSLMGKADGSNMNLTFSGMKLADATTAGRFTKATMLDSLHFQDQNNTAVYDFTKDEDWSGTNHIHNVTYGKEIGGTLEYADDSNPNPGQEKYSQSVEFVSHTGNGFDGPNKDSFAGYLPYVREPYDAVNGYHEIQVNGSLENISKGCGTYSDPYQISSFAELQSIASFIASGHASKNWRLNFPSYEAYGESSFCSGKDDKTHTQYYYDGSVWKKVNNQNQTVGLSTTPETLTNDSVRKYLCNAYYLITKDIEAPGFRGLGTMEYPFRGVIVGDKKTITLTGAIPKGFIVSSYGSVVKDINLSIGGLVTVSFSNIKTDYTMENCFGGVIANVLGGDNIIENVNVTYSGTNQITPAGTKPYLIPIGGYIGLIQGGGVIFRGTNRLKGNAYNGGENYYYSNPYVGRVLQGFAVNEGTSNLNNTEKNYQICNLDSLKTGDNKEISVTDSSINLNSAQALLIFTSITNSGAAGNGQLRSYLTSARSSWSESGFDFTNNGGKVRNASYANVGNVTDADDTDYKLSLMDDFQGFDSGNASYLDTHYAGGSLHSICHENNPYSITLSNPTYDMSVYGNGYRSIGPRYLTTAVCTNENNVSYKLTNPRISGVNGNGARIQPNITVKEYVDDEYHAIAIGGLFNTVRLVDTPSGDDNYTTFDKVTIGGIKGEGGSAITATVSHEYWELSNGMWVDATHKNWDRNVAGFTNLNYGQGRGLVAVGGFIGNTSMETSNTKVKFDAINTQYLNIKGPFDAGGILGHTGLRLTTSQQETTSKKYNIYQLMNSIDADIVPAFNNCVFESLTIDGGWMVGGYIGIAINKLNAPPAGNSLNDNGKTIRISFTDTRWLGKNSNIMCQRYKSDNGIDNALPPGATSGIVKCLPAAGGLIGCSGYAISINNDGRASLENVAVRSSRSVGGVIGWPFANVTLKNVDVKGLSEDNKTQIGDLRTYKNAEEKTAGVPCSEFAGGMIGYMEGVGILDVSDCSVENVLVVSSFRSPSGNKSNYPCYAAGIVGDVITNKTHKIRNCQVKNLMLASDNMDIDDYKNYSITNIKDLPVSYAGAFMGRLNGGSLQGANLLADNVTYAVVNKNRDRTAYLLNAGSADRSVYLAGVSIQNPGELMGAKNADTNYSIGNATPNSWYVAYADYLGTAQVTTSSNPAQTQGNIPDTVKPFVTTSPKGVAIPVGNADTQVYLYGDGANPQIVNQIWTDTNSNNSSRFNYSKPKGYGDNSWEDSYDLSKYCNSTFYEEMGLTAETANGIPNFPVLTVPLSEDKTATTKEIVGYLNLITNNGYWKASSLSNKVTTKIDQYSIPEGQNYFVVTENADTVLKRDGSDFRTVGYDTGNNRFEMITITFTEANISYKVQVPIVVRRKLEIDFSATIKDSPSFRESDYEKYDENGFKPNTTAGYGVTVSALLKYTYNQAIGVPQEYSWQYLLDSGDFPKSPAQSIGFYNPSSGLKSLPKGTQLVLLDCMDNNKAYHYTVESQSETAGSSIPLSKFKDSNGNSFFHWLSMILQVTATANDEGKWVKIDEKDSSLATVKAMDGTYYCPWKEGLTGTRWDLEVGEQQPTETFYLVMYIPESCVSSIPESSGSEGKNLNGYIYSSFEELQKKVQVNVNAVRKNIQSSIVIDPRENSECTYNFLSGYVQNLSDHSIDKNAITENDPEAYILLDQPEQDGNYLLHMDLVDEITVVKGQKDTAETPLFYKADISLANYSKTGNDSITLKSANGFPTGCFGQVNFYVYVMDGEEKKYYTYTSNGEQISWNLVAERTSALVYDWEADGSNMELFFGTNNSVSKPTSLAGIREIAKQNGEKIYIETELDIHMSVPAAEQVIAGSITKGSAFTKLSYTTYLSSSETGFTSTNYVESKVGEVRYYQSRSGNSTITHSANDSTQLGINCSDLTSANGVIYTTGVYDLTTVSNAEKLIQDADKVVYTLTLWQKQNDGGYVQITKNLDKYISSVLIKENPVSYQNGYQWTDVKNGNFSSIDPENNKRFLIPIRVQVDTDVETNEVTFANYQLRLTATLYKNSTILDQPLNEKKDGEKTNYDYVTYTITRILTNGYWGEN